MPNNVLELLEDGITKRLNGMLKKSKRLESYLNTVIYKRYQEAQLKRFQTEGASEGGKWDALSATYAKRKKIIYGGGPKHKWVGGKSPWAADGAWPVYPGKGNIMLVATGELVASVIGPGLSGTEFKQDSKYHRKIVTDKSLEVTTTIPYGEYVAEKREFMEMGEDTLNDMYAMIERFVTSELT